MKRTALTGLFLTAALLGSPVFAADDLCDANLQTLKDAQVSSGTNLSEDTKAEMAKTVKDAMAAKAADDEKECIAITTKQITALKTIGSGDSAK
jgi:nitric oxide reductase large subunit